MNNQKGMTLLEILIVIMMLSILLSSIYGIYSISLASWRIGVNRCEIIPQARIVLEKMAKEISKAKAESIHLDSPSEIQFETYDNKICYYLCENNLLKANITEGENPDNKEGAIIARGVDNIIFLQNPLTQGVNILITVSSGEEHIILNTTVFPRN